MKKPELELLDGSYFSLKFPYNAGAIRRVRGLRDRRWNKDESRWEVHIAHLEEVMKHFNLERDAVDRRLLRSFQIQRIRHARLRFAPGNTTVQITGPGLPIKKVDEVTSFFLPGYQFMPSFQAGQWDGKRHLFDAKRQTVPTGLLHRVLAILDADGVEYELAQSEDGEIPVASLKTKAPALELRDYQIECIEEALRARRGILELATGAGKTAIAAVLIHRIEKPALVLVHTRDLLHQTRDFLSKQLGIAIGTVGDGKVDIQPVTVATVQTCSRALGLKLGRNEEEEALEEDTTEIKSAAEQIQELVRTVPVVFFDECHHLPADTCYALAMETNAAGHRYGLSATPYRSDRQDLLLEAALGPGIYRANASSLIEKGFLVAPKITFLAIPGKRYIGKQPEYQEVFTDYIVDNNRRNTLIAERAQALAAKGKSVLILVSQVRHGEVLQKLLPEVPLLQGSASGDERAELLKRLQKKELKIVIATTLADEGLDVPTLDAVILASGGRSETRALQRVGRVLRPASKKREALVFDFADDAPYLKEHALRRLEIFRSEPGFNVSLEKAKRDA